MPLSRPLSCLRHSTILPLCVLLAACGGEPEKEEEAAPPPRVMATAATEDLSKQLEALTGNHTRVVWSHHLGKGNTDPFSNGSSHELVGIDSRDGLGVRVIRPGKDNFSRPIITPDGEHILFTHKDVERDDQGRKIFDMTILMTDWDGTEPVKLHSGFAVDVWADPETGRQWVYAIHDVPPTTRISFAAKRLVRFPIDDPETTELVWDQTDISPDNIQLSRDGKRASGQIPWPTGGQFMLDGEATDFFQTTIGCWAGMAPDNSYVSWMLDGGHVFVNLYVDSPEERRWKLDFSAVEGIGKGEIYHPRWSNHPRFVAITGPYIGETSGPDESVIGKGGRTAEVIVVKVNESVDGIEGSVTLTDNNAVDVYPDVWIAGSDDLILDGFEQGAVHHSTTAEEAWPNEESLLFVWRDRGAENVVQGREGQRIDCSLVPKGAARSGYHLEALLDRGSFEPKALTQDYLKQVLTTDHPIVLDFNLLATDGTQLTGPLLQIPGFRITLEQGIVFVNGVALADRPLPPPCHVAIRFLDTRAVLFVNGTQLQPVQVPEDPGIETVVAGGGGLEAGLQGLAIHGDLINGYIVDAAQYWQPRNQIAMEVNPNRIRVRGKLVEASGPPTAAGIDPYTRAFVDQVFEVEEVLEGSYEGDRILVRQWAMMDLQLTTTYTQEVGSVVELTLEPVDDRPELEGERVVDDTTAFDLSPWYDLAPPSL